MNPYKKCTSNAYSFLGIDVIDKIRGEKLQYDIDREAAKISALPSGKINKYEIFTGEELLLSDQRRVIEQG